MNKCKSYKITILSFFFLLLLMNNTLAGELNCSADLSDRFAPSVTMPRGKHKGLCMNTALKRALVKLAEDDSYVYVANFRYSSKFFLAQIPKSGFKAVDFVVVDLNGQKLTRLLGINISHVELKIKMKEDSYIKLYDQKLLPQNSEIQISDIHDFLTKNQAYRQVKEFVISINYMGPKDAKYSALGGFDETLFSSVIQFLDFETEKYIRLGEAFNNLYSITISEDNSFISRVVHTAITESDKNQFSVPYDTWTSNCANLLFKIIDQALALDGKTIPQFKFEVNTFKDTNFFPAIKAFAARGLIIPEAKFISENSANGEVIFNSPSNRYFKRFLDKTSSEILRDSHWTSFLGDQ